MENNYARPKYGFGHFKIAFFLVFARNVYNSLLGNTHFPTIQALLPMLNSAVQAYSDALDAALGRDKNKVADRNLKRGILETTLRDAAFLVTAVTTDRDILLTTAFELTEGRGPVTPIGQVQGVKFYFEPGVSGSIKLRWKRTSVEEAASFVVEQTSGNPADSETQWVTVAFSRKCSCVIGNLSPGETYSWRIYGIGALGAGGKSEPVSTIAL